MHMEGNVEKDGKAPCIDAPIDSISPIARQVNANGATDFPSPGRFATPTALCAAAMAEVVDALA
jgi:hypothetical protein